MERPRPRRHHVPEQGHRRLRRPALGRHADLQPRRRLRRRRDAASRSSCAATTTSQHTKTDHAVRRAGRGAPAVCAPADDPRHRRQEAEQAPRRHRRRRLPAHGHPPRGDAQLPRAARLVARRTTSKSCPCDDMVEPVLARTACSKKAAVFDPKKLEWMNGQHLSRATAERLLPVVALGLEEAGLASPKDIGARREWFLALIDLLKVRARTVHDIVRQAAPYLRETIEYDPEMVAKQWKRFRRGHRRSATDAQRSRDCVRLVASRAGGFPRSVGGNAGHDQGKDLSAPSTGAHGSRREPRDF